MKKYFTSALAIALVGAAFASIAQSTPMDPSSHHMGVPGMMGMKGMGHDGMPCAQDHAAGGMMGMNPAEMQAMREAMQKKMSAAQTDEERQALMAEQHRLMMQKRMGMGMGAMPM